MSQSNQSPKLVCTIKTDAATHHGARPACWNSRSTSHVSGVSPSAPVTRGSSNKDSATGRVTAQGDDGSPTHSPRLFRPPTHQPPLLAGLRLGKLAHELSNLIGPPSRRLNPEDHQSRPGPRAHEFWVSPLLPSPCCGQSDAVNLCGASSGSPITAQSADDGRIDCELRSTEEWQPPSTVRYHDPCRVHHLTNCIPLSFLCPKFACPTS